MFKNIFQPQKTKQTILQYVVLRLKPDMSLEERSLPFSSREMALDWLEAWGLDAETYVIMESVRIVKNDQ